MQAHLTQFRSVTVLLSAAPWAEGDARAALTLLVSGLLLLTEADRLRLLPLGAAGSAALTAAGLGDAAPLWTPLDTLARTAHGGLRLTSVLIDPVAWWTTPHGAADRRTLAYLEKRLALEAARVQTKKASAKPQRGLARLFRILRGRP